MTGRRGDIAQYGGFRVDIIDNHVQSPVAVEIANGQSSTAPRRRQTASRCRTDAFKLAVAQILEQQSLLSIAGAPLMLVDDGINVPVRDHQIQPTVIVIIQKARAPTQKWERRLAYPGESGEIRKITITVIVIKHVRVVRKICDMKTDAS